MVAFCQYVGALGAFAVAAVKYFAADALVNLLNFIIAASKELSALSASTKTLAAKLIIVVHTRFHVFR